MLQFDLKPESEDHAYIEFECRENNRIKGLLDLVPINLLVGM